MRRISIALALAVSMPMAAWGEDLSFNSLRGHASCLRSIAYRAGCRVGGDEHCPMVWIASLKLCRADMTDKWAYRASLMSWKFAKFLEDHSRREHQECEFSKWVARRQAEERQRGDAPGGQPSPHRD